jgi:hypothetical protein
VGQDTRWAIAQVRAAVVEFNHYHDEVLPTFVHAFNELGAVPDVYVSERSARRDAFALATGLQFRLEVIDWRARILGTPNRFRRYDLLVLNSVEPPNILEVADRLVLPTIAVLHNANLIVESGPYRSYFEHSDRQPMVLSPHVAKRLGADMAERWIVPLVFGDVPAGVVRREPRTTLCVQGNVEFDRRDYVSLVHAVDQLARERSDFLVRVVGRSDTPDGAALRGLIRDLDLARLFEFTDGEVSHREYLAMIAASDFLLPLLSQENSTLSPYFRYKITMSMSWSIGMGIIPIAEASVAAIYGVEDAAVTYDPAGLVDGLRRAIELGPVLRSDYVRRLQKIRSSLLASSVANLAATIDRLGIRR